VKKIFITFILFCSLQSQAQTLLSSSSPTGLTFPNSTANMVVELLRGIMNYALTELKLAKEKEIKLATIIEENFED
jgi:hypothetical protein